MANDEQPMSLPKEEQEAVYLVLEAISPDIEWRSLYPDDLCFSGPHGVVCDLFSEEESVAVPHVVDLNFGYVSEFSPNPPCGLNSRFPPRLSGSSFPYLRKLFFYNCFDDSSSSSSTEITLSDTFWDLLPTSSLEELVFVENPSLGGTLSSRLGSFTRLNRLVISGSRVSGEIPDEIGELGNLLELVLSRSRVSGRVPRRLGNCGSLRILDLSANQLDGPIPPEMGQLNALLKLDMSENILSGQVPPELAALRDLEFLDLSKNNLSGGVPAAVAAMTELRELHLSWNPLGGRIPEGMWESLADNLLGLGISGAGLVGDIPSAMGVLQKLSFLALDRNGLKGGIPEELRKIEKTAREINLENNRLSGRVPFSAEFAARIGRKLKLGGNERLCLDGELAAVKRRRPGDLPGGFSSLMACHGVEFPEPALSPLPPSGGAVGRCRGGPFFTFFLPLLLLL